MNNYSSSFDTIADSAVCNPRDLFRDVLGNFLHGGLQSFRMGWDKLGMDV